MEKKEGGLSKITVIGVLLIVVLLCVGLYFGIIKIFQDNLIYDTSSSTSQISNGKLYELADFPKVDASLATQPLVQAIKENFTQNANLSYESYDFTNTHPAYVRLVNDEVDLIVVTQPSEEELKIAKDKGVELEVIPVVKEGFVFYVNKDNKVSSLTTEQIEGIYSGEITNWKEVGGEDIAIKAYQRPVNSGSQTGMLELVMKGKKLMTAPKENLVETMAQIVNLVSSYDNGKAAIGYSYYYYATTMYETIDKNVAGNIKFLAINGVEPNTQTIKDDSYPYTTAYYIVINKADDENSASRKLVKELLSERGQKVALDAGYVPVK